MQSDLFLDKSYSAFDDHCDKLDLTMTQKVHMHLKILTLSALNIFTNAHDLVLLEGQRERAEPVHKDGSSPFAQALLDRLRMTHFLFAVSFPIPSSQFTLKKNWYVFSPQCPNLTDPSQLL